MRWPFRRAKTRRRTAVGTHRLETRPVRWAEPALPSPAVHLGFADGSEVELDDTHPGTQALREVAATLLVQGDR